MALSEAPTLLVDLSLHNVLFVEDLSDLYEYLPSFKHVPLDVATVIAILLRFQRLIMSGMSDCANGLIYDFYGEHVGGNVIDMTPDSIGEYIPEIVVVQQYFKHTSATRQKEFDDCLRHNLENPLIDRVVMLTESDTVASGVVALRHPKVIVSVIGKRLTYGDALRWAVARCESYALVAIANLDVYFDETIGYLYDIEMEGTCLALLRHEAGGLPGTDPLLFGPRPDSQDAWIFRLPLPPTAKLEEDGWDIELGRPGCDNAIGYELLKRRFRVANPCRTIRALHLHASAIRSYTPYDVVMRPQYVHVDPTQLMDIAYKTWPAVTSASNPQPVIRRIRLPNSAGAAARASGILSRMGLSVNCDNKWMPSANMIMPTTPYSVTNAFASPSGEVYTFRELYGASSERPLWIPGMGRTIAAKETIAVPVVEGGMSDAYTFLISVLPRILRVLRVAPNAECRLPDSPTLYSSLLTYLRWPTPSVRTVPYHPNVHVWGEKVYWAGYGSTTTPPQEDVDALRESLLPVFEYVDGARDETTECLRGVRIIVDMDDLCTRELWKEISRTLGLVWGAVKEMDPYAPVIDQLRAIRKANVAVVLAGSSLAKSIVFGRPGLQVIEIARAENVTVTAAHLAGALGLSYTLVPVVDEDPAVQQEHLLSDLSAAVLQCKVVHESPRLGPVSIPTQILDELTV